MSRRHRRNLLALATAAALGVGLIGAFGSDAARAAEPAPFHAEECIGQTYDDPKNAEGPVADLTHVFGERLEQYNTGNAVVLYDTFGSNVLRGEPAELMSVYPAVCIVREIDGAPVSEWSFCTDYFSQVCAGVDEDGNLLDDSGNPIPGVEPVAGGNPRISDADQRVIAHLIDQGSVYSGVGQWGWGGETLAEANGSVESRLALQTLIWCISDPVDPAAVDEIEADRRTTCETSMSAERLDQLRAEAPEPLLLGIEPGTSTVEVGQTGTVTLSSNVFGSPIRLTVNGDAALTLVSGSATLDDGILTISGTGSEPVTVQLALTVNAAGPVSVSALAVEEFTTVNWNQSPPLSQDSKPCQVYASMSRVDAIAFVEGVVAPTTEPSETPTTGPSETPTPAPSESPEPSATPTDGESQTPAPVAPNQPGTNPGLPSSGANGPVAPNAVGWAVALLGGAFCLTLVGRGRGVAEGA